MTEEQLFGEVLGGEYVDANLSESDDFLMAFQRAVTEVGWGWAWSRPGLDDKTRSMINLAMLTALGRFDELGIYVKGALRSGVTVQEIQEVLLHTVRVLRNPCRTPSLPGRTPNARGGRSIGLRTRLRMSLRRHQGWIWWEPMSLRWFASL